MCLPEALAKTFQFCEAWDAPRFTWSEAGMLFFLEDTNLWWSPDVHLGDNHLTSHSLVRVWCGDERETRKNDVSAIITCYRSPNLTATRFSGILLNRPWREWNVIKRLNGIALHKLDTEQCDMESHFHNIILTTSSIGRHFHSSSWAKMTVGHYKFPIFNDWIHGDILSYSCSFNSSCMD